MNPNGSMTPESLGFAALTANLRLIGTAQGGARYVGWVEVFYAGTHRIYDLALGAGMYRFDLVGYNRLEAGVLNLGWWYGPTTSDFAVIPQDNLFTAAVPIPAAVWLFGSGLLGLIGVARRKAQKA